MDHYNGSSGPGRLDGEGVNSKVVRIDIVPPESTKPNRVAEDTRELRLYEFLDEYESLLDGAEFSSRGGLNCCRAVVPLLKALETANELVVSMRVSRRPKESWKLSLLRAEVLKCAMNTKALAKRLEQYHMSLEPRGGPPSA